jgi:flavin-dependent dehydrogenase
VTLLDKASFPRDHVGESLSPSVLEAVRHLGAEQELRAAGFAPKAGATFAWGDDQRPWTVGYPAVNGPSAYQVRRAEFDMILLRAAGAAGADVRLGWRADDVEFSSGRSAGVLATTPEGSQVRLTAPWVVDASGADGLMNRRLGRTAGPPELDRVAVWGYWRLNGQASETTSGTSLLVGRQDACLWYYPLDDRFSMASVGVLISGRDAGRLLGDPPTEFYRSAVGSCPELASLMTGAVQEGGVHVTSASASASPRMAGNGWLLVGDAAFFVDALLTPGIQLAIQSGLLAAQCLRTIIGRPEAATAALDLYDLVLRREYETFTWLCRNLYGAADAGREAPAAARPQVPETNAQFAFFSLIAGLPKTELAGRFGAYMGMRGKAAARSGQHVIPGEKEGFAFLAWLRHQDDLARARADRITAELDESCVLAPAPGAAIGEELFVPSDGAQVLTSRMAVRNRLGDRFEATQELLALFETLGNECPYEKALWRFCPATDRHNAECRSKFTNWIKLLADYALVEWKPVHQGVT